MLGPGDSLDSHQNMRLRPLRPGEGRFLPVVATLGGTLFLEPWGWVMPAWGGSGLGAVEVSLRCIVSEGYNGSRIVNQDKVLL